MRSKRVLRYYCDHCKKSGCGKAAIMKHEARCVRNPARVCGFCAHIAEDDPEYAPPSNEELRAIFAKDGYKAMRERCRECPACTLATLLQCKAFGCEPDGEGGWPPAREWDDFNFKKEVQQFWNDHPRNPFEGGHA